MITLFGKPEPTLLERLKESVSKTKDALADTLDTITQGGTADRSVSVLKEVENRAAVGRSWREDYREILDSVREQMARNALCRRRQLKREIKAHVFRTSDASAVRPKLAGARPTATIRE